MSTEEQDAIQTTQIDGDVSVGRNVALGGGFISQGKGRVKGDLIVDGWLEAKNIKGVFKGIYLTVEKLKADFPEPEDGWWAIVGKTIPGPIYAADNGKWVATGEIGGQPTISGDEYYESLFEVLQYLTEEFDAFTATKGMPNGLAPLDSESKIPATYLPSYVDDVIEFAKTVESVTVQPSAIDKSSTDSGCSVIYDKAKNAFVLSVTDSTGTKYYKDWNDSDVFGNESDVGIVPQSGKVYVDNNENKTYRWSGTKLVVIGSDLSLGYTEATAFPGSDGKELQQTVALQEQAITSLTNTINSWDNKILNKLDKSVWDSIFVLHRGDEEDPTKITSIEVKANLWTNGEISAGGQREGGGGSAGGLIQTVYRYTQLNITLSDNDKTNTFNAYTIQQLANRIESLESTPSGISSLTINLGSVSYQGTGTTDVVVNLPAYPTSMAWGSITGKPTTISGYGITDAYTKQTVDDKIAALQSAISAINSWFTLSDGTLITTYNIAADGEVSAGGQSSGGGGGTGGLIQTVYGYSSLGGTFSDNNKNDTFNAYTINTLASRIGVLENTPSGIASLTVNLGTVSYVGTGTTDVTVNLPAYPTTLPASDVYAWAKQPNKPAYTAAEVGALTQAAADNRYLRLSGGTMSGDITMTGHALVWGQTIIDWNTVRGGLRLLHSVTSESNAADTYCVGIHVDTGYRFQLASSGGGNNSLHYRGYNGNTSSWDAWVQLLHTGNIGSFALTPSNYTSTLDSRYARTAYDNNLIYHGNEFNFIPSNYNDSIWINYRTQGGTNGNVSEYGFYNGSRQLSNILASTVTANAVLNTPSVQIYDNISTKANRLSMNWSGSMARIYAISNDGNSLRDLMIGRSEAADGVLYFDASALRWGIGTTSPTHLLHVAGVIHCDDFIYTSGASGWYNSTYGGGIYMTDSTWVRVYNSKGFRVSNDIYTTTKVIAVQGYQVGTSTDMGWYYYSTSGRIAAGLNTARGVNIGNLLVSNAWADDSKVPTNGIYSKGNIASAGEVSAGNASDRRLKKNISTLSEAETEHVLSALNPVSFTWNAKAEELSGGGKRGIARSFVADEFLSLLPNAGRRMWNDYDAIYTEQVVPYLTKGWQMHERRLSDHERRIQELEKENRELKRQFRRVA